MHAKKQINNGCKVSVVMPTYNRADKIIGPLKSVLNQTYPIDELLIVDDGSIDNTYDVVKNLMDERVRYIKLPKNVGPSAARNIGIKSAKSDVIAFADSDDIWHVDKIEKQISWLQEDCGAVYCAYQMSDTFGRGIEVPSRAMSRENLSGDIYGILMKGNVVGAPTLLVKKSILDEIGGFSEQLYALEDWDLAIRLAMRTRIHFVDEVLMDAASPAGGVNSVSENLADAYIKIGQSNYYSPDLYSMVREATIYYIGRIADEEKREDLKKRCIEAFPLSTNQDGWDYIWENSNRVLKNQLRLRLIKEICCDSKLLSFMAKYIRREDNVLIYGLGEVGMALADRCESLGIEHVSLMDKNYISYGGKRVFSPSDEGIIKSSSKIIVTIPEQFNSISDYLKGVANVECISVREMLL